MRGISFSTQASCCTPPFMDTCGSVMGGLSDLPGEAGLARWGGLAEKQNCKVAVEPNSRSLPSLSPES
jgi:hypothetical protein